MTDKPKDKKDPKIPEWAFSPRITKLLLQAKQQQQQSTIKHG